MITFVTFYMTLSSERRDHLRKSTPSFSVPDDAACWIDLLFRSARHFHSGCRCVLLTDEHSNLAVNEMVEVHRRPASSSDPLWSRLSAERAFLHENDDSSNVVFVDFDILVNASLAPIFAEPFDVALTYRPHPDMPINAGVILARSGGRKRVIDFFDCLLDIYGEHFHGDCWWGDQRALALLIGDDGRKEHPPNYVERDGVRIRLLPVEVCNYTPKRTRHLLCLRDQVFLLHFKGNRKPLMRDYWNAHHLRGERPDEPHLYRQEAAARLRLAVRAVLNL